MTATLEASQGTKLTTYFDNVFLPAWTDTCSAAVLQRYRLTVDWFLLFAGGDCTLADITDEKLREFDAWLRLTKRAGHKRVRIARRHIERMQQIRRRFLAGESFVQKDMTIADFVVRCILPDRQFSSHTLVQYRMTARAFSKALGSEGMLSELKPAFFDQFCQALEQRNLGSKKQKDYRDTLLAIWRYAYQCGYVPQGPDSEPPPEKAKIATAGDSLLHILTAKYYPSNFNIAHPDTKRQYSYAMKGFAEFLGREPVLGDLTDEAVTGWMRFMQEKGKVSTRTINERAGRVRALWNWLFKKGVIQFGPTFGLIRVPKKSPSAWTTEELNKLFDAASRFPGKFGDVRARIYWTALVHVLWNTGERIGAALAIERKWIDFQAGRLHIPAETRKGKKEAFYLLWPTTLAAVRALLDEHDQDKLFAIKRSDHGFYYRWARLLKFAGLPTGRDNGPHKVRRSFASHLAASGGDATKALMHTSAYITDKSYLDPRIVGAVPVKLFQPGSEFVATELDGQE